MYEENKKIDLFGEIKLDNLYQLLKTNSSKMNLEILSKLQNFNSSKEFFKYFIKKDINKFKENLSNFISDLSSLVNQNNDIHFEFKEEQYISDFSFIFFLFNFLSKINEALKEIINKTKYNLTKLYEKYQLDENYKEKINQYIEVILNISISKKPNKKYSSKSSTKDNSNGSLDINNISIEQILINDLLGKDINNGINSWQTKNILQSTPRFNDNDNNISYFEENKNNVKKNEENNIPLLKKKSIDSQFTLSSNRKIFNYSNNGKENIKDTSNTPTKNDEKNLKNDIRNFITNIKPDDFLIEHHKKRRSVYSRTFNSNRDLGRVRSNDKNGVDLFSSSKYNLNKSNNLTKKELYKKLHVSSGHLYMKEESNMYADLLEIISEFYKNEKITVEQKIKFKKLIICKSPKILNVYKFFRHNKEEFLNELTKLIQ